MLPKQDDKPRKHLKPYAEVCTFDDIDSLALFRKENYKIFISIGLTLSRMRPINCVSDTGPGLNLILEELVEPEWHPVIRLVNVPR